MILGPLHGCTLLGSGSAFPERELDNAAVLASLPTRSGREMSPDRLAFIAQGVTETMGLERRFWAYDPTCDASPTPFKDAGEEDSAALATRAARAALDDAGVAPEEVDALIVTTSTPHRYTATVSAQVSHALGIEATCFDLRAGCSAGLMALSHAALLLQAGCQRVLIIGCETFSAVIPTHHRTSALSLGDGAAALVVGPGEGTIEAISTCSSGSFKDLVTTPGAMPPNTASIDAGDYRLTGDPERLSEVALEKYVEAISSVLDHSGRSPAQITRFLPHQTSFAMIDAVCQRVGISSEITWREGVPRYANIGSAGWMVALSESSDGHPPTRGDVFLIAAVGGGLSWGAALWIW